MAASRPRLTVVSAEIPSPQSASGFAARLHHFLSAARREMDVSLGLVDVAGSLEPAPELGVLPADRVTTLPVPMPAWRRRGPAGQLLRGLVQYPFDPLPYHCWPRRLPALDALLARDRPDAIVFYLPYLAALALSRPDETPVVAALEEPWEWVVEATIGGGSRKDVWLARREATRFARLYRRLDARVQAVVAISDAEAAYFERLMPHTEIDVIPHGVDTRYFRPADPGGPGAGGAGGSGERDIDVLVVGRLDAPHNLEGTMAVWDAARGAEPGWRWGFVGGIDAGTAATLQAAGCLVTGPVDDVRPFYERARCVLVPALVGRGVKTTSLQAWAMGRPLVASAVGAQGLPAREGENILVGADASAMVTQLRRVLEDSELAERLAAGGRATAEHERDLDALADTFARLCARVAGG